MMRMRKSDSHNDDDDNNDNDDNNKNNNMRTKRTCDEDTKIKKRTRMKRDDADEG